MRKTHTYNDDYGMMVDEDALDADSEDGEESADGIGEDEDGAETDDLSEEDETEDLE